MAARTNTLNNQGKNFGDILDQNTNGSDDILVQLLRALGIGSTGDITGTDRKDWNKQLLDTLVSHMSTVENRLYNESLRDEQRIYDNPMSQLARLMGAGISRDQAIQMLGAGGSGSGGAAVPYSDPSAIAEGIAPSQSDLNHAQAVTAKLNTGLGFVSAAAGLVSLGFSAAQAIPQINMLKNQEYLSSKQRSAFDDSASVFHVISSSKTKIDDNTFGSITSVGKTLEALATSGNASAKALLDQGVMQRLSESAPYSLPYLNQMYRNEKDPSYYTRYMDDQHKRIATQNRLDRANTRKMGKELQLIDAEISELHAREDYQRALEKLQPHIAANYDAQKQLADATANQIKLSNELQESWMRSTDSEGVSGVQLFSEFERKKLIDGLGRLNLCATEEQWKAEADRILSDNKSAALSLTLAMLYTQGKIDAIQNLDNDPNNNDFELFNLCDVMYDTHYLEYVVNKAEVNTKGEVGFTPFFKTSTSGVNDISNPDVDAFMRPKLRLK